MATLRSGVLYFVLVFGAGFLLGTARVLWVVPRVGQRIAELMEMPAMLAVVAVAARWIVSRSRVRLSSGRWLGVGAIALLLLLGAELTVALRLRGFSPGEYVAGLDPVAGPTYGLMLGVFALMPWLVARRHVRPDPR
jgi:hypothetical protein